MSSDIKVSVCVVTYNQEKYIAECLQSLVEQVTDFPFEIIVGEDCSTDRTREIVLDFQRKYPDIIKPLLHVENVGFSQNYLMTHAKAFGKYIAHMDGDDYTLPGKLQLQVDFLDKNPNCHILWHPMLIEMSDGYIKHPNIDRQAAMLYKRHFYRKDILQLIAIGGNSSKMYRKTVRDFNIPLFEVVDYFANVEQVGEGYATFSGDIPLGVYRAGTGIASSGSTTREILAKCFLYFFDKYPEHRLQINVAVLTYLLADFKNSRPTKWLFLRVYLKTFKFLSLFELLRSLKVINMMRKG
ncbi:glycosyltransferase family 2 protein [Vibrio cholerae]|uniref:glycosyltransferase family 2 protein n=1 Tax=Vibrio cholerae TaxID=666 RepID=UPI003080803D